MKYILTPEQMRNTDRYAIDTLAIPAIILMENAARSSAIYIRKFLNEQHSSDCKILLLCGNGNNGGDGFALARHLKNDYEVSVLWLGSLDKMSEETSVNFNTLNKIGISTNHIGKEDDIAEKFPEADCIIDAMIGVGGSENLKGLVVPLLQKANSAKAVKIAIDAPTGLNTDTGFSHENAFRADLTVTMFAIKTGMLLNEGLDHCGKIQIADLGAPKEIVKRFSETYCIESSDLHSLIPSRNRISSKFDYGKVVIIAGSRNMPGAAALAANSAITAGAGLVYLFTPQVHSSLLPEVIPVVVPSNDVGAFAMKGLDVVMPWVEKADVVAFGPGFGPAKETVLFSKMLIESIPQEIPVIIDGDGLKAVDFDTKLRSNLLLTPHIGEFAAIIGAKREDVATKTAILAREWAAKLDCNVLLKHVPSIITNGKQSYWNMNGNPGMATAGSGDVLTGLIASFAAQKHDLFQAAALGAYLHGAAGDWFAENYGYSSLTASALIQSLREVLK